MNRFADCNAFAVRYSADPCDVEYALETIYSVADRACLDLGLPAPFRETKLVDGNFYAITFVFDLRKFAQVDAAKRRAAQNIFDRLCKRGAMPQESCWITID